MESTSHFSKNALEDFKLIEQALSGNEKAYSSLMSKYSKSVHHIAVRIVHNTDDAEDVMVETFTRAFKNMHKFKKEHAFSTWLFRIASNNSIDFIRKKKLKTLSIHNEKQMEDGTSIRIDIKDNDPHPYDKIVQLERKEMIREYIKLLPIKYGEIIELRYFENFTYSEIVEKTHVPLGTVKTRLYKAKELLYALIKKTEHN